jgi:hypothetical protein
MLQCAGARSFEKTASPKLPCSTTRLSFQVGAVFHVNVDTRARNREPGDELKDVSIQLLHLKWGPLVLPPATCPAAACSAPSCVCLAGCLQVVPEHGQGARILRQWLPLPGGRFGGAR